MPHTGKTNITMIHIQLKNKQPRTISFLGRLTIINILLGIIISSRNLFSHLGQMDLNDFIFTNTALISTTVLNYLIVFFLLFFVTKRTTSIKKIFFTYVTAFTLILLFLLIDTAFYLKLGLHLYAMVSYDLSFLQQGFKEMSSEFLPMFFLALPVIALLQYYLARQVMPFMGKVNLLKRHIPHQWKVALITITTLTLITEKSIFVVAQFTNNKAIKRYVLAIPFYPKSLAMLIPSFSRTTNNEQESALQHPLRTLSTNTSQYNIIWVTIEGLNTSQRKKNQLPKFEKIASNSLDFTNLYATSARQEYNQFSSYFGLMPSYFSLFQQENRQPLFIQYLQEDHYDLKAFLPQPIERSTIKKLAFLEIEQPIQTPDKLTANKTVLQYFKSWVITRDKQGPFAAFLHFDACMYPFTFNIQEAKHFPFNNEPNFVFPEKENFKLLNAYRNALHFQDKLLADLWSFTRQQAWSDHTIIIISASGIAPNIAHKTTESLQKYQVPFLLHLPKTPAKTIDKTAQTTDIVPTVLAALNCTTRPKHYSNGHNLLGPNPHDYLAFWFKDSVKLFAIDKQKKFRFYKPKNSEQQLKWFRTETTKFNAEY